MAPKATEETREEVAIMQLISRPSRISVESVRIHSEHPAMRAIEDGAEHLEIRMYRRDMKSREVGYYFRVRRFNPSTRTYLQEG